MHTPLGQRAISELNGERPVIRMQSVLWLKILDKFPGKSVSEKVTGYSNLGFVSAQAWLSGRTEAYLQSLWSMQMND